MVNCVERLFWINKYAARVQTGVQITLYSVDNIQNWLLSRTVCSETILYIIKNVFFFSIKDVRRLCISLLNNRLNTDSNEIGR